MIVPAGVEPLSLEDDLYCIAEAEDARTPDCIEWIVTGQYVDDDCDISAACGHITDEHIQVIKGEIRAAKTARRRK